MSIPSELGHLTVPINVPKGKPVGQSEFRTRDLSAPGHTLCRCATLVRQESSRVGRSNFDILALKNVLVFRLGVRIAK